MKKFNQYLSIHKKLLGMVFGAMIFSAAMGLTLTKVRGQGEVKRIEPSTADQQPIKDLFTEEQKALRDVANSYQGQINGALRVLAAQTKDPKTGKSLDIGQAPGQWAAMANEQPQPGQPADLSKGIHFELIEAPKPPEPKPGQ